MWIFLLILKWIFIILGILLGLVLLCSLLVLCVPVRYRAAGDIREKIQYNDIPDAFKGFPTVLLTAGLMAIAFFGFSGLI